MTNFGSAQSELDQIIAFWDEKARSRGLYEGRQLFLGQEALGDKVISWQVTNGVRGRKILPFGLLSHLDWAYRWSGRPWISAVLEFPEGGPVGEPVCNYDLPPDSVELRDPALYAYELDARPRAPELVPGWMKVELAVVGAWDLLTDTQRWDSGGPTGVPQSPGSVGVELPAGAEWALPWEEVPGAGPRPVPGEPVAVPVRPVEPEPPAAPEWVSPAGGSVVEAGPMVAVASAWSRLADEFPAVVTLQAGPGARPSGLGVAPALAEVVSVFPGVDVSPFLFDWPGEESQAWPELGVRTSYQPVWAGPGGREAIVVRIDPADGSAGEVVWLTDDGAHNVVGSDVVSFWVDLTEFAAGGAVADSWFEATSYAVEDHDGDMSFAPGYFEEVFEGVLDEWLESRAAAYAG